MIRFVDIRGQYIGYNFAFWNTIYDRFEKFSEDYAWDDWTEFEESYKGDDLERFKGLCPGWVFTNKGGLEMNNNGQKEWKVGDEICTLNERLCNRIVSVQNCHLLAWSDIVREHNLPDKFIYQADVKTGKVTILDKKKED